MMSFVAGVLCGSPFALWVFSWRRGKAQVEPQRAQGSSCNVPAPPLEDWQQ